MAKISRDDVRTRGISPDIPAPRSKNPKLETIDDWIDFYLALQRAAATNPDSKAQQYLMKQADKKLEELQQLRKQHGGRVKIKSIVEVPVEQWQVWKLRYFDDDWWTNEGYIHTDLAEARKMAKAFRDQPTSVSIAVLKRGRTPGLGDGPERCCDCEYTERDLQFEETDCSALNKGLVDTGKLYQFCPFRKVEDVRAEIKAESAATRPRTTDSG